MSERISLQALGRHLLRECDELQAHSAPQNRAASFKIREIEITLPMAAADGALPTIAIGEPEPLLLTEALQQLKRLDTKAEVNAAEVENHPAESIRQFKLRLRF